MNPGLPRPPTVRRRPPCDLQAAILSTPKEWPSSEAELRRLRKERPLSSPAVSESPAGPPADLLPQLPRPRTSDFFKGPQTPPLSDSTHAHAGQKRPRPLHLGHEVVAASRPGGGTSTASSPGIWPNSWSHYHFSSEESTRSPPLLVVTSCELLPTPPPQWQYFSWKSRVRPSQLLL